MTSKYYRPQDHRRMVTASSYQELYQVALGIIERMPEPIGLVSGPISTGGVGSRQENLALFSRYIAQLSWQGRNIFDQMPMQEHFSRLLEAGVPDLLEHFYGTLLDSGLIRTMYQIPGWYTSTGAVWEADRATRNGITLIRLAPLV